MPGRKRTRPTSQKTTASGSLDSSLPKNDRRTGNRIQEGKERDIRDISASLSETIHHRKFGVFEDRILRDVFIVNMNNHDAQKELCRSTKTPEEVCRIALSYERGNKDATSYVATGSLGTQGSSSGGGIQIKLEPVVTIRRGYRKNCARGRGSYQGRGSNRGGNLFQNNQCYNCYQPNFTREHLDRCPAKRVTCNFCHKIGHYERTCRGKRGNQRGRGAVGMIRENVDETHLKNSADEEASQHASFIG